MAPLPVGVVLVQSVHILLRNLVPFGLLAFGISVVESTLYWMVIGDGVFDAVDQLSGADEAVLFQPAVSFQMIVYMAVRIGIAWIVTAALVYGTIQHLRGRPADVGDSIAQGLALVFPGIGVILVSGLLVLAGLLLFVVPGVFAYALFWVAVPVAVVERTGINASLRRSAALTRGNRWRILGLTVVLIMFQWLLAEAVTLPMDLFTDSAEPAGFFATLVYLILDTVYLALSAVVTAVGYYYLRVAYDGADIEQIATVFD